MLIYRKIDGGDKLLLFRFC